VTANEVVVGEVERDRCLQPLRRLAERVGQSRRSANLHPHGEVLAFDKAGGDARRIGIAPHRLDLHTHNLGRTITTGADRLGLVKLHDLSVVNVRAEGAVYRVNVGGEGIGRELDPVGESGGKVGDEYVSFPPGALGDAVAGNQLVALMNEALRKTEKARRETRKMLGRLDEVVEAATEIRDKLVAGLKQRKAALAQLRKGTKRTTKGRRARKL
jgi:hypothetical protein